MISPFELNGKWWIKLNGVDTGPFDTEELAWEALDQWLDKRNCANGSCEE